MKKIFTIDWFYAALIRAIKTFAQTFGAMIVVGASLSDIDWLNIASVASVALILSLITSIKGLPEVTTDGRVYVNMDDPSQETLSLVLDNQLDQIASQNQLRLKVAMVPPMNDPQIPSQE